MRVALLVASLACSAWLASRLVADRARMMRGLEALNGRVQELQSAVDSVRHVFSAVMMALVLIHAGECADGSAARTCCQWSQLAERLVAVHEPVAAAQATRAAGGADVGRRDRARTGGADLQRTGEWARLRQHPRPCAKARPAVAEVPTLREHTLAAGDRVRHRWRETACRHRVSIAGPPGALRDQTDRG